MSVTASAHLAHSAAEPADSPESATSSRVNLSSLLRYTGASAVVLSLLAFLLKGWAGSDDLFKFSLLLASTTSIAAIALIIARYLSEMKSPRLLLSLALIAVPINFSIMGAFILYATSSTSGVDYPDYLAWTIGSPLQAALTAVIGVALLVPVIWLGFRTLSRGVSVKLTLAFVASNLLLLIPIREPLFVAVVAIGLSTLAVLVSAGEIRQRVETKTSEGKLALLIQLIPLGILVGRNIWLYATDDLVLLACVGVMFVLLRQFALVLGEASKLRAVVNVASLVPVLMSIPLFGSVLDAAGLSETFTILLASVFSAAMSYEISLRNKGQTMLYRGASILIACVGCGSVVFGYDSALGSTFVGLFGVGAALLGVQWQHKAMTAAGIVLVAFAGIDVASHVLTFFNLGAWISLMVVGVSAIVAASLVDTHGQIFRGQIAKRQQQYEQWQF